ncbi:primosomal replication protein N'' [Kluyvera ascorbata]|uniref:Primosomal replication protein N n=1 Tax=Kluyvera ascorbata TaxID=51288 RepID=A0A3N2SG29_9ENTR|nr:primosomal replication protein N'' [Kluyvera ascorbata]ROU18461.1 primosomal replication protein N'' [Kluyvera ascorbata]HDG1666762.1 primosomal replication protein N'' [Kluyvera ascorbata]
MKTAQLLQTLEQQLARLQTRVAPLAAHATLSARFDRQLFQTRSTKMQAYLDEAHAHLEELKHAVEQQQLPQVAWLAERLAAQIEAISRESEAWSLRVWDSPSPGLRRWQRKRLETQDFERRLLEMKQQRQQQYQQATTLDDQQRLAREITAFDGRLSRCRQALEDIERILARMTR